MAISNLSSATETEAEAEMLLSGSTSSTVDGYVDYKGQPSSRLNSGGWRSAFFIVGVEVAEKCTYFGILSNLISYLTGQLGQSTAAAAANVNAWSGTTSLLPLLGAFVADSFLGRYCTIVLGSLIQILGLGLLSLSALLTYLSNSDCQNKNKDSTESSCSPPQIQTIIFFFSLYLLAFGQGGCRPCVLAFGADQFDEGNPKESKSKSSLFNWWFFFITMSNALALLVVIYIEDSVSWALAFGILCAMMVSAMVVFMLGTKTYRYSSSAAAETQMKKEQNSPFARIGRVFVAAFKNWKSASSTTDYNPVIMTSELEEAQQTQCSQQFKFLNKALLAASSEKAGKLCSVTDVEEAKALLRLIPIWSTCLVYAMVCAQPSTFFTKQAATMDRKIFPGINISAASLKIFIGITIFLFIPIYDRVLVPTARAVTQNPSGITMLQRVGIGMVLSVTCMVVSGFVEMKRLEIAEEYGLIDKPKATVPMSAWWLVPQFVLYGLSDVFASIGLQQFFYDQVPKELRSLGLSLFLSVIGVGNFLSSSLVSFIDEITSANGGVSWFANNLNEARLYYFYWLLAGLNVLGFVGYLYFAKSYIYNK